MKASYQSLHYEYYYVSYLYISSSYIPQLESILFKMSEIR